MFAGKKSAQIREILISESTWEEMTCLFAPSLGKRECVTRSFSVAFHHTLANSQLWAVLDDSRSG
ncbi:hypothetical protein E7V02_24635 [Escherichia coli]|uniref:Uncharacterized protein n=1 Tax=Escherichia coli TaxID=562 RepID=A0A168PS15_ECOLX|nr:hypothetical protein [Escherichia coli]MDI4309698.1 hypothetical protein [Escherichia coli]MDN1694838.1 hypothetical protein [Escherichia coli]